MHYTDHPVLQLLFNEKPVNKEKNKKVCDDIFYEFLIYVKENSTKTYFILLLKFIILFRECMNKSKSTEINQPTNLAQNLASNLSNEHKKEFSSENSAESAPDLCNEFITEFLENNDYFGIEDEKDRNEFVDIIQHFCYWLFKNEYTPSRLTLIN